MKRSVVSSPAALSPEARQLLELGSFVAPPTPEQDARMGRALARSIALDRAAAPAARLGPSGSPGARAPLERTPRGPAWRLSSALPRSGLSKLWLTVGALAATAGASFWVGRASVAERTQPASATVVVEMPVQVPVAASREMSQQMSGTPRAMLQEVLQQLPAASVQPAEARADAVSKGASLGPSARSPDDTMHTEVGSGVRAPTPLDAGANPSIAPRAKRASSPEVPPSPLGLSAEIARLARAEAALRQGRATQALIELEPPAAHLHEHAAALRAVAECTLDRAHAAPAARETLERWPASAFAPRIREACGL